MFYNTIKSSMRNIVRNRLFSLVNITGLALAIAACLLIGLYVYYEWNYDKQSPHASQIWRAYNETISEGNVITQDANSHGILGPTLKKDLPEIADYTRFYNHGEKEVQVVLDNVPQKITNAWMADPGFLNMFPQRFIKGDAATSLQEPYSLIITENTAHRLFKGEEPLGKVIQIPGGWFRGNYTVKAVVADPPANTHLKFSMLASYASRYAQGHVEDWSGYWDYTYFQLVPGADVAKVKRQLEAYSDSHLKGEGIRLRMQPLTDIHLTSNLTYEIEPNGDIRTIRILGIIAFVILGIAFINYINLTTAQALVRAKEVGVRKVLGASRTKLVRQFIVEGSLLSLLAVIVAVVLVFLSLPYFESFAGLELIGYPGFQDYFWLLIPLIWLLGIVAACVYPAFVLSSFSPLATIRGRFGITSNTGLRKILVIIQFACSTILIVAVIIVTQQLKYMREHHKGLSLDQVVAIKLPQTDWTQDSINREKVSLFHQQVSQLATIKAMGSSSVVPGQGITTIAGSSGGMYWTGNPSNVVPSTIYYYNTDSSFYNTYGITFLSGVPYTAPDRRSASQHIIINETLATLLGFPHAASAVGQQMAYASNSDFKMTIHGVVKDFHIESSKEPVRPTLYFCSPLVTSGYMSLKISASQASYVIEQIEAKWKDVFPLSTFEYFFVDEMFQQQFQSEERLAYIITGFTAFAIFIACIGLFGLVFITTGQRRKEIGVRKVLGASVMNIVMLLSKDYLKLIVVAIVIAIPVAVVLLNNWLQGFAYRVNIQWWVFTIAALVATAVSMLTISLQSVKAANTNPVKNLRTE